MEDPGVAWRCSFESTTLPAEAEAAGAAELEVEAAADDVLVERDGGGGAAATAEAAGGIGKADIKIFDLGAPIRCEGIFDAGAGGPAGLRRALKWQAARSRLHIGKRGAAGAVEEHPIPGIAGAAAHGGEPVALGLTAYDGARAVGRGVVETLPIAVAFDAEHELANLIVGADRAAEQSAADVEAAGIAKDRIEKVAVAERAAAVETDVEP